MNRDAKTSVHNRILRIKYLLQEWSRTGFPSDVKLPTSLNKIREWEKPDLGIEKIGSKRDFTKTHRLWGDDVKEIDELLKSLKPQRSNRTPHYRSESSRRVLAQTKLRENEILLAKVTSQWHEEREALRKASAKIEHLELSNRLLADKNSALEAQLSEARRELASRDGSIRLLRPNDVG
ncbi:MULTISPECIES: hypothetical protein [Brucella]|uniref:hypothetical protein n=1 Tax=Brucella TaxID=234 RepID=UPI00124EF200|nr:MULTISPECIES: hypothetical protein [Brucella]KAB2720572.1 hypothetical protein F9K73_11560 [Brucella intermedia]KAB2800629.1 hypothetical protein F9K87_04000 [Brucella anthropi]